MSSWWAEGRTPPKGSTSRRSDTPSRRSLQKNSINKEKNEWTCICVRKRKGQADSCRSMQAGCASFLSGLHSIDPAQCWMQSGSLVSVCALNENGGSHPVLRKRHQGVWRGRQKDIATPHVTMKTEAETKTREVFQANITSLPLCTIQRVLILGIAF